jgi:patatin-related protein
MYGGVSLAIYINGIAQELLRWVRSTAKDANSNVALLPSNPTNGGASDSNTPKLSGTERVYRKLSYVLANNGDGTTTDAPTKLKQAEAQLANNEPLNTRFVVDILSGTSAGGINGIFLAKALANGQDIRDLEALWITEGDISTLINDKKSIEKPLKLQDPPASLLNSQRMYLELLKAFDGMEKTNSGASYVDEMDLFVTTTDLSGVTLPIRLSDGVVYERRHRNVLRFVYSKKDVSGEDDRNDFESRYNPFLAYAARCTSAFPVAFEPMCLCDTDTILERYGSYKADENCRSESKEWQRFYKDYLNPAGVLTVKFPKRAFADGGYLDNKPFTYATETVARRQADLLITRKLIYIEPSPEHPEEDRETEGKPDAIENVGAALLSLPRYETIREDLERLREHNRLVERVNYILKSVDLDMEKAGLQRRPQYTDEDWGKLDLMEVVAAKGPGYVAYHRLEIASVTDDLAKLVTRVAGFDEASDYFLIIRSLVRAWRKRNYVEYGKGMPSLNTFLFEFNLAFPMRRINFLRTKISERAASKYCRGNPEAQAELLEIKRQLNTEYKNLQHTARLLRSRQVPAEPETHPSYSSPPSPAYDAIKNLKLAIADATLKQLPEAARLRLEEAVRRKQKDLGESVLEYFLGNRLNGESGISADRIEDECNNRAETLLNYNPAIAALFESTATALKAHIGPAKSTADRNCRKALGVIAEDPEGSGSNPPTSQKNSREYLGYYYEYYDEYDRIIFPIVYGTEIGEAAKVDVVRISPEDAKTLIDERDTGCYKLAGSALGHFGAFLDPLWRRNDILWGRLDGVERIITALLPNEPKLARMLIGEAHAAIVQDAIGTLGETQARNLLCESSMRTKSGSSDCKLLEQFIGNLKTHAPELLRNDLNKLIDDKALQQHYVDTFPKRSRLEPESTVRNVARATTVIGKLLEGLSSSRRVSTKPALWIARLGRIFWALVEVAIPRSFADLFFRHWLKLIYFLEALMILGSTLLLAPGAQRFAITAFGITAAVHLAVVILGDLIQSQNKWAKLAKAIGIVILVTVIAIGGFAVSAILGVEFAWKWMTRAREWIAASQSGFIWGLIGIVFLIFFWSIRKDVKELFD